MVPSSAIDFDEALVELDLSNGDDDDDDVDISIDSDPSYTFKINFETGHIEGVTDDEDAIRQSILTALNTERYKYAIFSEDYGMELEDLYGKDDIYVSAVLETRIRECLEQDDRIEKIENYEYEWTDKHTLIVSFEVILKTGDIIQQDEEVMV